MKKMTHVRPADDSNVQQKNKSSARIQQESHLFDHQLQLGHIVDEEGDVSEAFA